jgi:hypothetical protein
MHEIIAKISKPYLAAWMAQSDQNSCCSPQTVLQVEKLIANNMDPVQSVRIRRLVWIYAGGKPIMLVLSWRGSNDFSRLTLLSM